MVTETKPMELSKDAFTLLRKYIHVSCGILVAEEKEYLIKQRLEPIIISYGFSGFEELHEKLKFPPMGLKDEVIRAVTTNETSFFRDDTPFRLFNNHILPKLGALVEERKNRSYMRKGSKVRIWCAASSTGQEPYTLAMLIREYCEKKGNMEPEDFSIMATDINAHVLAQAMEGKYSRLEVGRGLDDARIAQYFRQDGNTWYIQEELKMMIEYKILNLADSFLALGGFDLVLCRNVLIYFDDPTKGKILDQINNLLSDDGCLLLGSSENIYGVCDKFSSQHVDNALLFTKNGCMK